MLKDKNNSRNTKISNLLCCKHIETNWLFKHKNARKIARINKINENILEKMKKMNQKQTKQTYLDARTRAEKTIATLIERRLHKFAYNIRYRKTNYAGRTLLEFNGDGRKYGFVFVTRWNDSYTMPDEAIERSLKNKLLKIAPNYDVFRYIVMYTDGKTADIDIAGDSYDEDKMQFPKRTIKEGESDYIMKYVCHYNKRFNDDLQFDADWVYSGKRKPIIAVEVEQKDVVKALF